MDDNLYPLYLGPTIEESATLKGWGYRRDPYQLEKREMELRHQELRAVILGTPRKNASVNNSQGAKS
jgi:hypothetical protein